MKRWRSMLMSGLLVSMVQAADRAPNYASGAAQASDQGVPLIVYVHGSDWCLLGQRLKAGVWDVRSLDRLLRKTPAILVDVDVLQTATDEAKARNDTRNKGFKAAGVVTYPAVIAYAPDGQVLASAQGEGLPRNAAEARGVMVDLIDAAHQATVQLAAADAAAKADDSERERIAWMALIDLPVERPSHMLERLALVDPDDSSGARARLSLPPFHRLIAEATAAVKKGQPEQELKRLIALRANPAYTPTQRAWIQVAIASVYRQWAGHEAQAKAAFDHAVELAPDSLAGHAARRMSLRFYSDASLEFGWSPEQCDTNAIWWTVEDVLAPLAPGVYELTLQWTRGRHALVIESVRLMDGPTIIDQLDRGGRTGTKNENNTFLLRSTASLSDPSIQIRVRSDGGTNSHGTISLRLRGED